MDIQMCLDCDLNTIKMLARVGIYICVLYAMHRAVSTCDYMCDVQLHKQVIF